MNSKSNSSSISRRRFLGVTGSAVAVLPGATRARALSATEPASPSAPSATTRKIPIGVFTPAYDHLSLDQMLDKISALGLEAVEVGTGAYPAAKHCPVEDLLADPAKARVWKKKFEDRNILVAALSCHGNPLHPDQAIAQRDDADFRKTVLLAERLEVPVVVTFSGCPGGSPTDTMPNWATYRWPDEYDQVLKWQWSERVIPYWKRAAKFAREHGVRRIALEMHAGFVVYNPHKVVRLREAVGEEIGANCDPSHLFWQGCDPVQVIHYLAQQNALFHAHMKDAVLIQPEAARYGVLDFEAEPLKLSPGSVMFRAVGYGHSAQLWKDIVKAYMDVGFQGILSIENEDPLLPGEVGVERAAYVLKNVREELLSGT
ncbi:MAG: sugar phosphate isomerase/epimerase family protein [Terriglobia bacterium]